MKKRGSKNRGGLIDNIISGVVVVIVIAFIGYIVYLCTGYDPFYQPPNSSITSSEATRSLGFVGGISNITLVNGNPSSTSTGVKIENGATANVDAKIKGFPTGIDITGSGTVGNINSGTKITRY